MVILCEVAGSSTAKTQVTQVNGFTRVYEGEGYDFDKARESEDIRGGLISVYAGVNIIWGETEEGKSCVCWASVGSGSCRGKGAARLLWMWSWEALQDERGEIQSAPFGKRKQNINMEFSQKQMIFNITRMAAPSWSLH